MATQQATVSRGARRFLLASVGFLIAWLAGALAGVGRPTEVILGVLGFVLHALFGKAYSLVPAYFDRDLAFPRAPAVQVPLTVAGTGALALATLGVGPDRLGTAGAAAWCAGVAVILGTLAWTVRDNPTGSETGTGPSKAERRPVDRAANAVVPVAGLYLAAGSYALLAGRAGLPAPVTGLPRVAHLLAAGTAALMVFGVGFRLLPRFLVAHPPRTLVAVVLPAGALGPAALGATLYGDGFRLAAAVEAVAVVGFAAGYVVLFVRSDRRRVGLYGVLAGAGCGAVAAVLGLSFAFEGVLPGLATAHFRLNVLGFLGLTILGLVYQFYPPTVGNWPGTTDRVALASLAAIGGGLLANVVGLATDLGTLATGGLLGALAGAVTVAYVLTAAFRARPT